MLVFRMVISRGNPNGKQFHHPFVIDTSNATLGPTLDLGPQWSLDFTAQPTNLFVEPSGRHLYVALGPYSDNLYAGFDVYDIDGNTGELDNLSEVDTAGPSLVSAMDPKGRFLFQAYGEYNSWLSSFQLSPADGSIAATTRSLSTIRWCMPSLRIPAGISCMST